MNKTIRVLAVGCYGAANVGDELLLLIPGVKAGARAWWSSRALVPTA